jgi:diguanylate cyclase
MSFDLPLDDSISLLKRALPLMSRQRVPTIPQNYAVWFEFVAGSNPALREEIETMIQQGTPFTPTRCRELYLRYALQPEQENIEDLRGQLGGVILQAMARMGELGADLGRFGEVLESVDGQLSDSMTPEAMQELIEGLVSETAQARQKTAMVEGTLQEMATEIEELRHEIDRLSRDSETDALTGIANRRAFDRELARLLEAVEPQQPLALIFADIDHFKCFNDEHGHLVGDQVLRAVASELSRSLQGQDLVARYGGEEFAVLLPFTNYNAAMVQAESLRTLVESTALYDDAGERVRRVTLSLGVALATGEDSAESLIARADAALYASKGAGRNRVTGEQALA